MENELKTLGSLFVGRHKATGKLILAPHGRPWNNIGHARGECTSRTSWKPEKRAEEQEAYEILELTASVVAVHPVKRAKGTK